MGTEAITVLLSKQGNCLPRLQAIKLINLQMNYCLCVQSYDKSASKTLLTCTYEATRISLTHVKVSSEIKEGKRS